MVNAKSNSIRFYCEIILSVLTIALGIAFIIELADIYYGAGDVIYSREIVGERLKIMLIPTILWVLLIIACFVLSVITNVGKKAHTAELQDKVKTLRTRIAVNTQVGVPEEWNAYLACERWGLGIYAFALLFSLVSAIITIVNICAIPSTYQGVINDSVLILLKNALPFIAVSFVLFIAAAVYEKVVAKKQLERLQKLIKDKKAQVSANAQNGFIGKLMDKAADKEKLLVTIARISVFAVAVLFIVLGAFNGGITDVLQKAINICTECIGLG